MHLVPTLVGGEQQYDNHVHANTTLAAWQQHGSSTAAARWCQQPTAYTNVAHRRLVVQQGRGHQHGSNTLHAYQQPAAYTSTTHNGLLRCKDRHDGLHGFFQMSCIGTWACSVTCSARLNSKIGWHSTNGCYSATFKVNDQLARHQRLLFCHP